MKNNLQVIFGTGPLGQSVARALVERGRPVRMVSRSGKAVPVAGVEVLAADANHPEQARSACAGAEVVFQCAQPEYHRWPQEFPALQSSILEAAASAGARLVIGENLYMYGEVDGPIHEGLPYTARTRKGRVRAQMAEQALAAHRAGKLRVALGRGSDFFGPGVLGSALGERIFIPMLQGKPADVAGNLDMPHTYTFIPDFGNALVTLSEREEAFGQAWHVPNAETLTTRQVLDLVFELAGMPAQTRSMGKWMMRLGGLFIPAAREMVEMMYEFEKPFVVDHSKFARAFGNSATPLREALRQTLEWYRRH